MKKAPKGTTRGVFVVDKEGKVLAAEAGVGHFISSNLDLFCILAQICAQSCSKPQTRVKTLSAIGCFVLSYLVHEESEG